MEVLSSRPVYGAILNEMQPKLMPDSQKNVEIFEAVVIGGGPAGCAAAYTLASNNVRTCVIDRSAFPREKLCGGLVTQRSKRIFEQVFARQWDEELFLASSDVEFRLNGKLLEGENLRGHSVMYFTMRIQFDAYLLGLVRQTSAVLKLNAKVVSIDLESNTIRLKNGDHIQFKFLIGADGVNSQVAKQLYGTSFDPSTIGFGLEVEVPRDDLPSRENLVEIDFGAANWGYGWIFPKRKSFTIGVGGIHRLNADLKTQLAKYLAFKKLDISNYRVKGQYIPFGDFRKCPGQQNVLLCGDAAGAVDPITGEGIAYAMQTGHAAANAIIASRISTGRSVVDLYLSAYKDISRPIKQATHWRYLIFPKLILKPFSWAFADAGTLQRGYLDILAGKHDYNALCGLFAIQVGKGLRKLFRVILAKIGIGKPPSN